MVLSWAVPTPQTIAAVGSNWELPRPVSNFFVSRTFSFQVSESSYNCSSNRRTSLSLKQSDTWALQIVLTMEFRMKHVFILSTQSTLIITCDFLVSVLDSKPLHKPLKYRCPPIKNSDHIPYLTLPYLTLPPSLQSNSSCLEKKTKLTKLN